jgi:hypothetical protein
MPSISDAARAVECHDTLHVGDERLEQACVHVPGGQWKDQEAEASRNQSIATTMKSQ